MQQSRKHQIQAALQRKVAPRLRMKRAHGCSQLTTELSDSRPAVITPVVLDNRGASPKPATRELQSGAAVRSSDLVSPRQGVLLSTATRDADNND